MKRRRFLALVAPLGLSVLLAACGQPETWPSIASGQTVLAFGDSVTFGTGAASGEDWPGLLAEQTGWQIVNAGVPGDTTEAAQGRIQGLLDEHRPALVIIELGGNDFLRRRPANAVKEDIRHLIQTSRRAGAQVALVAVPELSLLAVVAGKTADAPLYAELGKEEKIPVVNDVFSEILGNAELRADQIHPNAEGYRQMAAGIQARLKAVGLAP